MGLKFSTSESQDYRLSLNINGNSTVIHTKKDPKKFTKQYSTFISEHDGEEGVIVFTYTNRNRVEAGHDHYCNQARMYGRNTDKYEKFVE
jgi:hypothetical protein